MVLFEWIISKWVIYPLVWMLFVHEVSWGLFKPTLNCALNLWWPWYLRYIIPWINTFFLKCCFCSDTHSYFLLILCILLFSFKALESPLYLLQIYMSVSSSLCLYSYIFCLYFIRFRPISWWLLRQCFDLICVSLTCLH